jgi:hypothetical protein
MTIAEMTTTTALHARINGRSEDLDLAGLELAPNATDAAILEALGARYEIDLTTGYVVAREGKAIIVRPVAFYG